MAYLDGSEPRALATRFLQESHTTTPHEWATRYGPPRNPERQGVAPYYFLEDPSDPASVPNFSEFRAQWKDSLGRQYARGAARDTLFVRIPRQAPQGRQAPMEFPSPRETLLLTPVRGGGDAVNVRVDALLFRRTATGLLQVSGADQLVSVSTPPADLKKRLERHEEKQRRKADKLRLPLEQLQVFQASRVRVEKQQQHSSFKAPKAPRL